MDTYEKTIGVLATRYKQIMLSKENFAEIMNVSIGTVDKWIASNQNIPKYIKLGEAKNASIRFNITEVASYLVNKESKS